MSDAVASAAPHEAIPVRPGKAKDTRVRTRKRQAYKALVGWLGVAAAWLVRGLPVGAAVAAGRGAGLLAYLLSPSDRRIAHESLAIAFPEKTADERLRIARESFARLGASGMEWAVWPHGTRGIERDVTIVGKENLDSALARGKGVLWITGHVGNWELMGASISAAGFRCAVIATTVRYPALNAWSIARRGEYGVETIERESSTAGRELLRKLRNNWNLGILLDHDTKVPSVQVDFFGRKAWTAVGVAELAVKLGCSAVPSFITRTATGHVIHVGPPIHPPEDVPKAEQLRAARDLTQQYTWWIEAHVRAHPEDWAWMHRRWK